MLNAEQVVARLHALREHLDDKTVVDSLIDDIEGGVLNHPQYSKLCQTFIGRKMQTSFGSGFFGRAGREYLLRDCVIQDIYGQEDEYFVVVVVNENTLARYEGELLGSWAHWSVLYDLLCEWVGEEQKVEVE